ncbi:MAG: YtxH domain-containing protein [Dehalococcoidia bacterium]|jgi:gas vesicle protein|nr:YtxH domain-containing protein [Dehalococcoidia bacterium]
MASENNGPNFFTGLLLGGIIGAILGLLFAPQPGEKTREQLRGKIDEITSLGKSAWDEGKEAASQKGEELKAKFEQARHKLD